MIPQNLVAIGSLTTKLLWKTLFRRRPELAPQSMQHKFKVLVLIRELVDISIQALTTVAFVLPSVQFVIFLNFKNFVF